MDSLHLIVGLGNPGRQYARTRHNAGFMAVDRLVERGKAKWTSEPKFNARLARAELGGRKVLLCEPGTFMNQSGQAVAAVSDFFKVPRERLLIVVDDADLPFGQVRMRPDGSSGGHHGLESIEQSFGTRGYARLRIGIGRQDSAVREIAGHVLGKFRLDEFELLEEILDRAASQVECWIEHGIQKAMNQFNGAVAAPTDKG